MNKSEARGNEKIKMDTCGGGNELKSDNDLYGYVLKSYLHFCRYQYLSGQEPFRSHVKWIFNDFFCALFCKGLHISLIFPLSVLNRCHLSETSQLHCTGRLHRHAPLLFLHTHACRCIHAHTNILVHIRSHSPISSVIVCH